MLNPQHLAIFATIVQAGSISGAATQLGCGKSVVSRQLARLETDLGAAQTVLAGLRAGTLGSEHETSIRKVAEKIDLFEIDDALTLLQELHTQLTRQA